MNRRMGIGIGLTVVVLALVVWRCAGSSPQATRPSTTANSAKVVTSGAATDRKPKVDPRTQARGSLAGTVRDDAKAPIAGATVCADTYAEGLPRDADPDPLCVTTDASGNYALKELLAAKYRLTAVAKTYRPQLFRDGGERGKWMLTLAAGEARTGVDFVLHAGGVEINGTVSDITGGPVAGAIVRASPGFWGGEQGPVTLTDKDGTYVLTVSPGTVRVYAMADGYANTFATGRAPGTIALLLTPESSLSGTVVDARTGAPVPAANVVISTGDYTGEDQQWDETDDKGTFRVNKLTPGRVTVTARSDHGYGRTEGSVLVGLGQHVEGVVVKLHPALTITGKVMIAGDKPTVCTEAGVWFKPANDNEGFIPAETEDDGTVIARGVLPGEYTAQVWCKDHQSRGKYPAVVVTDKDLRDLVWEVDAGATVRGKILNKRGEPIADARITGQTKGGEARESMDWVNDSSRFDGTYELIGLKPATYELEVASDRAVAPKEDFLIEAVAGKTVEKDLVLDDGGSIRTTVVDADGKPVADVTVNAIGADERWWFGRDAPHKTNAAGEVTIPALRPGDYRVYASRGMWGQSLRKAGTTDDSKQGEKAVVKAGETASVKLVVESQSASIKGSVVDADGAPVADAYISSARESDAAGAQGGGNIGGTRSWGWGDARAPIVTATDGTFTIDKLSPGKYTLRAYRKGGGEAVSEHVATGSTAKLQIKRTGSIEGAAKRDGGPPPAQLTVSIEDRKTGFERSEEFYGTDGKFVVRDLPGGAFQLTVRGEGSSKLVEVALAEGEAKTGVTVTLEKLIHITGRVVDAATKQPIEGIQVFAGPANSSNGPRFMYSEDDLEFVTDKEGRFKVKNVPSGQLSIQGMPKDWKTSPYSWFRVLRTVTGSGTVDVGELPVIKKRLQEGDQAGELGIRFAEQPPETPPDKQEMKVSYIDPAGPAANSGLQVGDVIITIDGVDVTGDASATAWTMMRAPPGTKLALGLARGVTVTVTLRAPT